MNKFKKIIAVGIAGLLVTGAFADPPKQKKAVPEKTATSDLAIVEAFQNTFRSISQALLPAVVEIDVVETRTRQNISPFGGLDDFFDGFGWPFGDFFGGRGGSQTPQEYQTQGLGSGVIVRHSGNTFYVVTNNHVAGSATDITVKLNDGREFKGKLVCTDERIDIALVSFEASDKTIPVATLGDSDKVQPGDICMAFGAPLGYSQSVTQGIVSAVGRSESQMSSVSDYIQTDAAINQGNSGGPLVNIYGEVIGINTWIASQSGGSIGVGFAVPVNNFKSAIDSFISSGKVSYGWLGVSLLETNKDFNEDLGVKSASGAFVAEVFMDSPAYKSGIKPGDFITKLDGKEVKNVNQLVRDVGKLPAGKISKFEVIRGGKTLPEISVKIEERKEENAKSNSKLWPGFIANPLTDEYKTSKKLEKKVKGVVVSNVEEKSPAASLRLQNGDIITAVNGVKVSTLADFYEELSKATKSVNFDLYSAAGTITTATYKF